MAKYSNTLQFAQQLDEADKLRDFRKLFYLPKVNGKKAVYLCGNSLGLQPKSVEKHIKTELKDWKKFGVEGHLHGKNPWLYYHHQFTQPLCRLLGAKPDEVVAMNQLTVNLNLLLISFYRPSGKRTKILMQANEFPSDYYAVEQQMRLHGIDPAKNIIEVMPRKGETLLREEDILKAIEKNKTELALVLFSGVNYYTGQLFNIKNISAAAQKYGIYCGIDLAHTIGNIPLRLHEWGVDFATWCSYKYLNSGPGGVSGIFVHQKHAKDFTIPRLAGWWGNDEKTRFKMGKNFKPVAGAQSWQISNAPILSMAAHKASLEIFNQTSMYALRQKSVQLTGYLAFLIAEINKETNAITIITPTNPSERGCQLSLRIKDGKKVFAALTKAGVIADWREPDVVRIAPVPLYNSFKDVYRFATILQNAIKQVAE